MSSFIYRIEPIIPPSRESSRTFLVSADLDYEFALKARETDMPEKVYEGFIKQGREIIKLFGLKNMGNVIPYNFLKGSWLLHYCTVPGDACDLGLEHFSHEHFLRSADEIRKEGGLERSVSYSPHNVDMKEQAFCLLSLWVKWANTAKLLLE